MCDILPESVLVTLYVTHNKCWLGKVYDGNICHKFGSKALQFKFEFWTGLEIFIFYFNSKMSFNISDFQTRHMLNDHLYNFILARTLILNLEHSLMTGKEEKGERENSLSWLSETDR